MVKIENLRKIIKTQHKYADEIIKKLKNTDKIYWISRLETLGEILDIIDNRYDKIDWIGVNHPRPKSGAYSSKSRSNSNRNMDCNGQYERR